MKCLAKSHAKEGIWLEDFDEPTYGNNDLLIRIHKTAICGTDVHIYNWDDWASQTIPVPMIVGHEFVGEVVAVGNDVERFKIGDRVSGEGHVVCGYCRNCRAGKRHLCRNTVGVGVNRPGCFAELLSIPAGNAFILPNDIPDDIACVLDPLGNATHTALSFDSVGEDVLITGAGPIGILAAAICRHVGARNVVITDVNEYRLNMAQKMGARCVNVVHHTLDEVMSDLGMVEGFDIGLEMSGNEAAFTDMIRHMNHGGRIALLGIPPGKSELDLKDIVFKGLVIKGIYGREMYETWYKMVAMLQSGLNINQIITHRFHVDDFAEAFAVMRSGKSGKIILDWANVPGSDVSTGADAKP